MTIDDCRRFYAQEIRFTANVRSSALVEAFARVPREKFLGPGPWEVASADVRGLVASGAMQMSHTPVDDPRDLYHNVLVVLDKAGDINNGQPSAWRAGLRRWISSRAIGPITSAVGSATTRQSWRKQLDRQGAWWALNYTLIWRRAQKRTCLVIRCLKRP